MSRVCKLTGKKPLRGNRVSKSNIKTNRFQYPNLQKKRIYIPELKKSSFEFKKHYEPRWVNSIYYDDMFNNSVYQNLDGNQKKQKIRIRWYGKKNLILKPFIEIKKKTGFVGYLL